MAKIALFSPYDSHAYGIRVIAKYLETKGHQPIVVFFKKDKSVVRNAPLADPFNYQTIQNGNLWHYHYDVDPWTEHEAGLLIDLFRELDPDAIGISSRSFLDEPNVRLMGMLREAFPDKILMGGGYGPVLNPEAYLAHCDFVCFGEGEEATLEMAEAIDAGTSLKGIRNLVYMEDGKLVSNPVRPPVACLEDFPLPAYGEDYIYCVDDEALTRGDPRPWDYFSTCVGRGCVSACAYCSAGQWVSMYKDKGITIKARRNRSVESIIGELEMAKAKGARFIEFQDSYLVGSKEYMQELFTAYKERIALPFFAFLHVRQLIDNPDLMDLIVEAGLADTDIGVQNGNEPFAAAIYNRTLDNNTILTGARMLKERGVAVRYNFIVANPMETEADFNASLDLAARLPFDINKDSILVYRLVVLPRTPLAATLRAADLPPVPTKTWHYNAMLYQFRAICDDETFAMVRDSPLFREDPCLMRELLQGIRIQRRLVTGETSFDPEEMLEVYRRQIALHRGEKILLWGTGQRYRDLRMLFEANRIEAIIDNNSALHGTTLDGYPVVGPEFLRTADPKWPVFILSNFKKEIRNQIIRDYPGERLIP